MHKSSIPRLDAEPTENAPTLLVGIGASAGGLEALEHFFSSVPLDTGLSFIVVQHLSPDFKSLMNELLSRWTSMPIHRVEHEMSVEPNAIYLMPPKTEMIISRGRLLLTEKDPQSGWTLPIDQFLRSLAEDAGQRAVAVVLSGTGSDGSRGIVDVHSNGGFVLVQDPESAKFDGMPRTALESGVADRVLPPEMMPKAILEHLHGPETAGDPDSTEQQVPTNSVNALFEILRDTYGIDFAYYKPTTVSRRLDRRLQLSRSRDLTEYVERIRKDPQELDALYQDLLIGVTRFFRDGDAFSLIDGSVLPRLLERLPQGQEFRAWVAACATGEEAYSLAILLDEHFRRLDRPCLAKIFATDVHRASLDIAGVGIYPEESLKDVSPERRARYFNRVSSGFQVSADLRKMIVFAPHNVMRDAPFTRLDFISCRNLLIYLEPEAQRKVISLFHFGLKHGGTLFLGPSESPGDIADEFDAIDTHWKLFRKRRDVRLPTDLRLPISSESSRPDGQFVSHRSSAPQLTEAFSSLLDETLPPSWLLDDNRQIVQTFGDAGRFLRLGRGTPSLDVLDLIDGDLRLATAGALQRVRRQRTACRLEGVRVDGEIVDLHVTPIASARDSTSFTLVSLKSIGQAEETVADDTRFDLAEASRDRVEVLENELRYTKENLQATIEELETSNEELQATNEELLASNEELQSTNEELHSVNEELYTVNAEYQKKIGELTELNRDMDSLLLSTEVHTIFLDEHLCIRKFTPKMGELFNLLPRDVGRRIDGFVHSLDDEHLQDRLSRALELSERSDIEVRDRRGCEFLMRILPYHSDEGRSAGVVVTLIDITPLRLAEARFRKAIEASPSAMLVINQQGLITLANSQSESMFGYSPDQIVGRPIETLIPDRFHEAHRRHVANYFDQPTVRPMGSGLELFGKRSDGTEIPVDVRISPVDGPDGVFVLASVVDITDRKRFEASLRDQVVQRDQFLAMLSHELRNPLAAVLSAVSVLDRFARDEPAIAAPCGVLGRQISQMATLLDDLLDVSRVTQGKIELQRTPCSLHTICREALEAVEPLARKREHNVTFEPPATDVWVSADRTRLLQIVENLVTNAVKYTPNGGEIRLSARANNGLGTIEVLDNGRGISEEQLSRIFDMFVQGDETLDRSEGGMGIGLTLVRRLVDLHGGTIRATSDGVGRGSRFTVELTRCNRPAPESPGNRALDVAPSDVRVALVEDNDDTREMLSMLLELEGFEITAAADGRKALELLAEWKPDVALIDIGLPELDGFQVARRCREFPHRSRMRLIALTGYGRDEDREAIIEAGFDDHLVKPVALANIKAKILAIAQHSSIDSES